VQALLGQGVSKGPREMALHSGCLLPIDAPNCVHAGTFRPRVSISQRPRYRRCTAAIQAHPLKRLQCEVQQTLLDWLRGSSAKAARLLALLMRSLCGTSHVFFLFRSASAALAVLDGGARGAGDPATQPLFSKDIRAGRGVMTVKLSDGIVYRVLEGLQARS